MLQKLSQLQREKSEQGFTLIELLVVILIIGILAAIAIPAFMNQRKAAVDASLESDLANIAQEVMTGQITSTDGIVSKQYVDKNGVKPLAFVTVPAFLLAPNTTVSTGNLVNVYGTGNGEFCLIGVNSGGDKGATTGITYDSLAGGLNGTGGACDKLPDVFGSSVNQEVPKMLEQVKDNSSTPKPGGGTENPGQEAGELVLSKTIDAYDQNPNGNWDGMGESYRVSLKYYKDGTVILETTSSAIANHSFELGGSLNGSEYMDFYGTRGAFVNGKATVSIGAAPERVDDFDAFLDVTQ